MQAVTYGTDFDGQRRAFYETLTYAWGVIAYEHFRYRSGDEDSIKMRQAAANLSYAYQRALAMGEPNPEIIKLDPQQVKILDALAEAANIPHQRGQTEIEIPENIRYHERYRFGSDGNLL